MQMQDVYGIRNELKENVTAVIAANDRVKNQQPISASMLISYIDKQFGYMGMNQLADFI